MPDSSGKLTAKEMRQLTGLIRAQAAIRDQLSETAARSVQRAFAAINTFNDPKQTAKAVNDSLKVVQAAQRRMAQVTDGYMASSTSLITGRRVAPVGAVDITKLRRQLPPAAIETLAQADTTPQGAGPELTAQEKANIERAQRAVSAVDPGQVYGRIADAYRYRVSTGLMTDERARQYVAQRASTVADTDIMLADRAQASQFLTERKPKNVLGYRRVLHPELGSGGPPCGLCVVAADRVYRIEDLMPLHAACRCGVTVVGSNDDPGFRLNEQDLAKIYKQAGYKRGGGPASSTAGARLKQIRVEVVEHGELGPWLVNPQQRFRGPREVAKTQSEDPALNALAQLEAIQEELQHLLVQQAAGLDVDEAIRWRRTKARQLDAVIPR